MRIVREVSLLQKKKIMVSRCFHLLNRISQVTCYQCLFLCLCVGMSKFYLFVSKVYEKVTFSVKYGILKVSLDLGAGSPLPEKDSPAA